MTRLDKLGREIPEFDRRAAAKKGAATSKERYGADYHSRIGADGGKRGASGYFRMLKEQGRNDELKAITQKGAEKTNSRSQEEKSQSAKKGWQTRRELEEAQGVASKVEAKGGGPEV